jgi:SAM-dependent methyltransferase
MGETEEIKKRYERRKNLPEKKRYSYFNTGNLFIIQERQRKIIGLLKRNGFEDLGDKTILDVGCGNGGWMRDFVQWGAKPELLFGIDLLAERIEEARKSNPNMSFVCASAEKMAFNNGTFDLVVVSTCFTSIFDDAMKNRIAKEILRVLKKDGLVLWYDFRYNNPRNLDVKGIKKKEIVELFGDCDYDFKSVTLAPPIVRTLAPISWLACELLAMIPSLKTHYLAIIRKKANK